MPDGRDQQTHYRASSAPAHYPQQRGEVERELYRHTHDAIALIRRRIARHAIECDLRDDGVILANWSRA